MNNKYYKRSKISEAKFRHLIKCFSLDLTATETAHLSGISLRSVTSIFDKLRRKIEQWCEHSESFEGTLEVDESYFGPKWISGKRGRGAGGKTIVFGISVGGTSTAMKKIRKDTVTATPQRASRREAADFPQRGLPHERCPLPRIRALG